MIEEIHVQISGRVQGVGFRSVVNQYALKYKIKGFVRNLADGRVEVCAQGSPRALQDFFREIQSNPGRGSIDRFDQKRVELGPIYPEFTVYY